MGSAAQGYSKRDNLRVTISADMFVRSLLYRSFAQIRRIQLYALFSRAGDVKQTRSAEHLMSYEVSCLMHCGFRCHACSRYDRERTSCSSAPKEHSAARQPLLAAEGGYQYGPVQGPRAGRPREPPTTQQYISNTTGW